MIGKIMLLSFVATSLGEIVHRDKPVHPTAHTTRSDIPRDVYNYLGNRPSLRTDDFIKLPKELFQKLFAKAGSNTAISEATENTTEHLFKSLPIDDNAKNSQSNTVENANPNDSKNDGAVKNALYGNNKNNSLSDSKNPSNYLQNSKYLQNPNDLKNYGGLKDSEPKSLQDYNPRNYESLNGNNELAAKQKLLGLIRETKLVVDRKIAPIQIVHEAYKSNRVYKIGYLVSNINRTHDSLNEFYAYIERNIRDWDILKTLNAYDQIKSADEFLSKALHILNVVGGPTNTRVKLNALKPRSMGSQRPADSSELFERLAWSYYDDTD